MLFGKKISKDFAIDIEIFSKCRSFSDGVDFCNFTCQWDRYKGDHKPSFEFSLIVLNFMIFQIIIYNIHHAKDEEMEVAYCPSCWIADDICFNCFRKLPNEEHRTEKGCVSCDSKYHKEKKK